MTPLFQRQNTVLNLAFRHALILLHRPFLLSNFADLAKSSSDKASAVQSVPRTNVADCVGAAQGVLEIVNNLWELGQLYQSFWVWIVMICNARR